MSDEVRGLALPFRIENGGVAMAEGTAKLRANLVQLILTSVGERVMRRDYGGGLEQLVHDPNNEPLRALVEYQVTKAVSQHEPRVRLTRLDVSQREGTLWVALEYVVLKTTAADSIALPVALTSP